MPAPPLACLDRDGTIIDEVGYLDRPERIEASLAAARPELLEGVTYLTTYRGKPIAPGSKSLSLRLFFRDPQGTLRHERVDPQVASVVERVRVDLSAELRA